MRGPNVPPWSSGPYGWRRPNEGVPDAEMRVSDAERREIADALSHHFGDGRLDRAEFDERMGRAMAAKTRGDLAGLLSDLPPVAEPVPDRFVARHRRSRSLLLMIGLGLFLVLSSSWAWHSLVWHGWVWQPHFGFFLLLALVFVVLRRGRRPWRGYRYGPPVR